MRRSLAAVSGLVLVAGLLAGCVLWDNPRSRALSQGRELIAEMRAQIAHHGADLTGDTFVDYVKAGSLQVGRVDFAPTEQDSSLIDSYHYVLIFDASASSATAHLSFWVAALGETGSFNNDRANLYACADAAYPLDDPTAITFTDRKDCGPFTDYIEAASEKVSIRDFGG